MTNLTSTQKSPRREKRRINLGLKQLLPNLWDVAGAKYFPGQKVKGKVVNLVPYGAFIELEPSIECLLHITELGWGRRHVTPARS
jgi:small subunit ribosomal protein S1